MAQDDDLSISPKRKRDAEPQPNFKIKRQRLFESRRKLPIWGRRDDIQQAVKDHDILILSGETGSGKSTQVPQFLEQSFGKTVVTQPRRVAAISLAKRVADEMGTPCGSSSPASKVGYSVRFDESTSLSTRIKFVTEGMLLQEMLRDQTLKQYGCIIVDEVHERSVNVDLILGFVKQLLLDRSKRKNALKVVIMSATADINSIAQFFENTPPCAERDGPALNGTNHSNGTDAEEGSWDGFSDNEETSGAHETTEDSFREANLSVSTNGSIEAGVRERSQLRVSTCHVEGRQYPVRLHYLDRPADDVLEGALQRIFQVHCKEPMPGDILVFLTGQEAIQGLQKLVEEYAANLTREFPKLLVLPLFAALSQSAQQRIFLPAPNNARKVILSTNLAETSITVPGIRFVVDTGKAKIRQFRSRLGLDSLLVKPISQSSAEQRKGRAGREAAGDCYRLYTEGDYLSLEKENTPEILRCDLGQAILNMKARGVKDVFDFPMLTPPPNQSMEKALLQLLQLAAVTEDGKISEIGRNIARLPLTPSLGRVIIEASRPDMNCLLEVIDIVSCLSVENIFLNVDTEEAREQTNASRSQLFRRQGDHLTLLAAVQAYADESSDRRRWADYHLISHRAMQSVMDVRKQLRAQCKAANLETESAVASASSTSGHEMRAENILKAFLRGFINNTARLCPDGSYKTFTGNQTVAIHPSSVLFGRKAEAIMYNEFVYTNRAYARGVSAIQLKWFEDVLAQTH